MKYLVFVIVSLLASTASAQAPTAAELQAEGAKLVADYNAGVSWAICAAASEQAVQKSELSRQRKIDKVAGVTNLYNIRAISAVIVDYDDLITALLKYGRRVPQFKQIQCSELPTKAADLSPLAQKTLSEARDATSRQYETIRQDSCDLPGWSCSRSY